MMDSSSDEDKPRVVYFQKNENHRAAVSVAPARAPVPEAPVLPVLVIPEDAHGQFVELDCQAAAEGTTSATESRSLVTLFQPSEKSGCDKNPAGTHKHNRSKQRGKARTCKSETARLLHSMQAGTCSNKSTRIFGASSSFTASCNLRLKAQHSECQPGTRVASVLKQACDQKGGSKSKKRPENPHDLSPCLYGERSSSAKLFGAPCEKHVRKVQGCLASTTLQDIQRPCVQSSIAQQVLSCSHTDFQNTNHLATLPQHVTPPPKSNLRPSFLAAQKSTGECHVPSSASLAHAAATWGPMASPANNPMMKRSHKRRFPGSDEPAQRQGHAPRSPSARVDDEIDEEATTPMLLDTPMMVPVAADLRLHTHSHDANDSKVPPKLAGAAVRPDLKGLADQRLARERLVATLPRVRLHASPHKSTGGRHSSHTAASSLERAMAAAQANVDALNREAQSLQSSSVLQRKRLECRIELPCCFESHLVKIFCSVQPFDGSAVGHDPAGLGKGSAGTNTTRHDESATAAACPSSATQATMDGATWAANCVADGNADVNGAASLFDMVNPATSVRGVRQDAPGKECQKQPPDGVSDGVNGGLKAVRASEEDHARALCAEEDEMRLLASIGHAFVFMHKALVGAARLGPSVGDCFTLLKPWDVVMLPGVEHPIVLAFVAAAA